MTIPENRLTLTENYAFIIDKHFLENRIGDLENLY